MKLSDLFSEIIKCGINPKGKNEAGIINELSELSLRNAKSDYDSGYITNQDFFISRLIKKIF